ncbi:PilZ domain-containing protein [Pseudoalteromonas sp. T1lg48]|uniref:PilZ domain-containing protein n=1 Tax=Pseudoalteromonas sp. T1lg48 TaxID=2077100 RepID=UPI000CF5F47B|nr:PilZ domain-containing protein [Pseudoalteromonas sp. T1lg48]
MAEDILQKHQPLVQELKQHLGEKGFNTAFDSKTAELSKGDQFIIKMELNRLRQPCSRVLDLRGLSKGEIQNYQYNNQHHFLDADAIAVFEQGVKRFGDYTQAVYEMVMQQVHHRREQRQQQAQIEHDEHEGGRLIRFASYESRQQERMNYAIKVRVLVNEQRIEGKTSDISLGGAKLKLPRHSLLKRGQSIRVRFTGLEEDFELGLKNGVEYQVVATEPSMDNEFYYARLKRGEGQEIPGFDAFLARFIDGNKRRYKVNLDNTLDAVLTKGYEQYYLPRLNSLFAFVCKQQGKLQPRLLLTTENSLESHTYFCDEERRTVIARLLNETRLNSVLAQPLTQLGQVKHTLLYSFTHSHNNKIYFYSATELELATHPHLRALFFAFGSRKPSWRVHKLQLLPVQGDDAHLPLSLPDSAGDAIAKLNKPPSARVYSYLRGLSHLCLLTPLHSPALTKRLRRYELDHSAVNQLKVFGHRRSHTPELEIVALEYANLRAHKRYLYATEITASTAQDIEIKAKSLDFSVLGMQIELAEAANIKKGEVITLALPQLQQITKKFHLAQLPYEVMAISKSGTVLNLKAYQKGRHPHAGVLFFAQLIDNNKDKLQQCEEEPKVPGLSKALRNIVIKNLCQTPLYFCKQDNQLALGAIGLGRYGNSIHHIWQHFGELGRHPDLSALFNGQNLQLLTDTLHQSNRQDKAKAFDLFIHVRPKEDKIANAISCRCIPIEQDYQAITPFINDALDGGLLFAYRLFLSKTGRPDTKYLLSELKYISHYALHKARELEDALWQVEGVIDALAIDELIPRLTHVDIGAYQGMVERRTKWLQRID